MARSERVLSLDIGSASIKAGEFEYAANGVITLTGFAVREYGEELTDANRAAVISASIRSLIQENGFTARKVMVSLSGQAAFIRFVKLPPVSDEEKRVRQIVEFEARQNVPFPMSEVIWDYQLIASPDMGEMDVMFVVIKNEIVEQITNLILGLQLVPVLVDVAPVACYNAARANHVGDDECSVILNIGSRSCNLLFADKNRFFARTIPIAGHAITQQIAKEFNIGLAEAEEMKRRHGFVALGGAYEEPESEVAATVSKIVRNVMARLHGEINRSITVYRSQQKGNRPTQMYLAGGSSTMVFTDRFFQEACEVNVSYLNPFQVVSIAPGVDVKHLEEVAHMFSEVVGLGLRYKVQCPVEISLIPENLRRAQAFSRKKPYLAAAAAVVLLGAGLGVLAERSFRDQYTGVHTGYKNTVDMQANFQKEIKAEINRQEAAQRTYDETAGLLRQRDQLPEVLNTLQALKPDDLWLVRVRPLYDDFKAGKPEAPAAPADGGMFGGGGFFGGGGGGAPAPAEAKGGKIGQVTFKVVGFELEGHSVSVKAAPPAAGNNPPAPLQAASGSKPPEELFETNIRGNPLFEINKSDIKITLSDAVPNLHSFTMLVKLKQPIEVKR